MHSPLMLVISPQPFCDYASAGLEQNGNFGEVALAQNAVGAALQSSAVTAVWTALQNVQILHLWCLGSTFVARHSHSHFGRVGLRHVIVVEAKVPLPKVLYSTGP